MPVTKKTPSPQRHVSSAAGRLFGFTILVAGLLNGGCDGTSGDAASTTVADEPEIKAPVLDDDRIAVGNKLLLEGRVKEASMVFDDVLEDHPRMGRANFYKGLTLHQSQSHAAALKWYEAALESGQNFTERKTLPYYMAWSCYYADQPEKARESIEEYLSQDSERADAHFLAGVIALEGGRMNDAELALRRAIELGEGDPEAERSMARAWIRLADLYTETGRFPEALEASDRAITLRPEMSEAWFRKYTIFVRLGNDAEAETARKRWKSLSALEAGRTPGS